MDHDDHQFANERKREKEERKRRSARDRSKYKKSDLKKRERQEIKPGSNLTTGRVLSIKSEGIIVEESGGLQRLCTLRGVLKKERGLDKNLITVGDIVHFEPLGGDEGAIAYVEPRRSVLSRADNLSRRKQQLIAANIDLVLITGSVIDPPLKPFLIDRYIIAAKKGAMAPIVIINKIDLLEEESEQRLLFEEASAAYAAAGVPFIAVSADEGSGLDALKAAMAGKTSVFSGQSGTGKSSLINAIVGTDLAVGETVSHTKKGAHTTTSAQLLPLAFGGWCIDTPGIKSFGVWALTLEEVESYYTEIHHTGESCRFSDCSHTHEEPCAVKNAVAAGEISLLRYESYLSLRDSIEQEHKRR